MSGWTDLRIAGTFSLLSAGALIGAAVLGIAMGGEGPAPIDFGDREVLARLASAGPTGVLLETLALLAPVLALGAGIGWLRLAGQESGLARVGVLLWYVGMIFVVAQDAAELGLVRILPGAVAHAGPAEEVALLAIGSVAGEIVRVFIVLGDLLSFGALGLVAAALVQRTGQVRWFGWLGLVCALFVILGLLVPILLPLRLLGFLLFVIWLAGLGLAMLRERTTPALQEPSPPTD
jgi:hypothetical protein